MTQGLLQREKMKRFVSDKLFESIESDEKSLDKATSLQEIAVLSCDIRSFTTISEKYSPEEVVRLLNDYLTEMEKSINTYGGSIEKIVGDAIISSFSGNMFSAFEYSSNASFMSLFSTAKSPAFMCS